jgi:hypothetical protein
VEINDLFGLTLGLTDTSFEIEMGLLLVDPFFLEQGDMIVVIGRAVNSAGAGDYSDPNETGIIMEMTPTTPPDAPIMISQAETTITVQMPEINGVDTGGSPILSYNLVYDQGGASQAFLSVIGLNPDNLLTVVSKGGLNTNVVYEFKYRVRNKHGWS